MHIFIKDSYAVGGKKRKGEEKRDNISSRLTEMCPG